MNPGSAIFLTGTLVLVGRWAEDETINHKIVVGLAFSALMLSIMAQYDKKFAGQFATLILVGVALRYGIPIYEKLGFGKYTVPE